MIYDISQTLRPGIAVWPGDEPFGIARTAQIKDGAPGNVSALRMSSHTGTHVDAPLHLFDGAGDAAGIPLEACIGPVRLFEVDRAGLLTAGDIARLDWSGVRRALFRTRRTPTAGAGWDLSAAEYLAGMGLVLVGTDAPSVDALDSVDLVCHRTLLGRGMVILEGADLGGVPPGDYLLCCLPLKLAGADGSPVRAVLYTTAASEGSRSTVSEMW